MSQAAFHVRPASRPDLDRLISLERAVFHPEPYPGYFLRQALDLWPGWFLVAEVSAALAGYTLAAPATTRGHAMILSLAVGSEWRGRGLARELVTALIERLGSAGVTDVSLTVHPDNRVAKNLYLGVGFEVLGSEPDYFGRSEPRLLLGRTLS